MQPLALLCFKLAARTNSNQTKYLLTWDKLSPLVYLNQSASSLPTWPARTPPSSTFISSPFHPIAHSEHQFGSWRNLYKQCFDESLKGTIEAIRKRTRASPAATWPLLPASSSLSNHLSGQLSLLMQIFHTRLLVQCLYASSISPAPSYCYTGTTC